MISIGCDHGGFDLKEVIVNYFKENNIEYNDVGCYSTESVDYPIYSYKVATEVSKEDSNLGIICCSTGIGVAIAANKVKKVRAATISDKFSAEMTRRHNNTNVLCLGGKILSNDEAIEIVKIFLNTEFEGERHQRRVDMITDIENNDFSV